MTMISSSRRKQVLSDMIDSLKQPGLWLHLGVRDVFLDHARASLGILWPMLSALAWISVIYFLIGSSLREDHDDYLAYLTVGIICYNFASRILVSGATTFRKHKGVILNIPNPLFIFPLRVTTNAAFTSSLQIVFVIGALIICKKPISVEMLMVVPVAILFLITGVFSTLIIGILGLRFGDLSFMMATVMRLMLFATPIFWYPAEAGIRKLVSTYNPLAHYMELMRAPLLGYPPDILSVMVVLGVTTLTVLAGTALFFSGRNEIARKL